MISVSLYYSALQHQVTTTSKLIDHSDTWDSSLWTHNSDKKFMVYHHMHIFSL